MAEDRAVFHRRAPGQYLRGPAADVWLALDQLGDAIGLMRRTMRQVPYDVGALLYYRARDLAEELEGVPLPGLAAGRRELPTPGSAAGGVPKWAEGATLTGPPAEAWAALGRLWHAIGAAHVVGLDLAVAGILQTRLLQLADEIENMAAPDPELAEGDGDGELVEG